MDGKVSKESFKAYRDWQRYILRATPKLSEGCTKPTLIAYCFAMAFHGGNGIGCYASDARIAKELGMYDDRSVRPYRHEALRLGWFVWTGEKKGRTQVLDIAIPSDDAGGDFSPRREVPSVTKPAVTEVPRVSADGHVYGADVVDCAGCKEYQRRMASGDPAADLPAWQVHKQATS
jgi:hypothetical protein